MRVRLVRATLYAVGVMVMHDIGADRVRVDEDESQAREGYLAPFV